MLRAMRHIMKPVCWIHSARRRRGDIDMETSLLDTRAAANDRAARINHFV